MNIFKIIFSVLSIFIIFYYTNLACPKSSSINDGSYFNNDSVLGYFINHKPGYVCPLGVILGKIMYNLDKKIYNIKMKMMIKFLIILHKEIY